MKLRILSVDFPMEGKGVENYNFYDAPSFSDYDAVIIDPQRISDLWVSKVTPDRDGSLETYVALDKGFGKQLASFMSHKENEIVSLLKITKGIVVCILRNRGQVLNLRQDHNSWTIHRYSWLPPFSYFEPLIRHGNEVRLINKHHPFCRYLNAFRDSLYFESVLQGDSKLMRPIATNKVGEPVAIEYSIGEGKLIFLPPSNVSAPEKVGGVLLDCLRGALKWSISLGKPDWVSAYSLPGESEIFSKIKGLDNEIMKIEAKKKEIESEHNKLEVLKGLLYEQGKYGLEPPVRAAFRFLGFNVLAPEGYEEEYDFLAKEDNLLVIGEIEGSEAQVDIAKYRQLLDYVDREETSNGNRVKGILIGNAFIRKEPEERGEQFTAAAIRGCRSRRFCRITTYELYKTVQAVLSGALQNEKIKEHILNCEDEFKVSALLESRGVYCGN